MNNGNPNNWKSYLKASCSVGSINNIAWTEKYSRAEGYITFSRSISLPCREPFDITVSKVTGNGCISVTQFSETNLLETGGLKSLEPNVPYKFVAKKIETCSHGYYDAADEGEVEQVTVAIPRS